MDESSQKLLLTISKSSNYTPERCQEISEALCSDLTERCPEFSSGDRNSESPMCIIDPSDARIVRIKDRSDQLVATFITRSRFRKSKDGEFTDYIKSMGQGKTVVILGFQTTKKFTVEYSNSEILKSENIHLFHIDDLDEDNYNKLLDILCHDVSNKSSPPISPDDSSVDPTVKIHKIASAEIETVIKKKNLSLYIGAGVCMPIGVPSWVDLLKNAILGISISNEADDNQLAYTAYKAFIKDELTNQSTTYISNFLNHLVEKSEKKQDFRTVLEPHIYPLHEKLSTQLFTNGLISDTADFIKKNGIRRVLTTNYDIYLEVALFIKDIQFQTFSNWDDDLGNTDDNTVEILHLHGLIVPKDEYIDQLLKICVVGGGETKKAGDLLECIAPDKGKIVICEDVYEEISQRAYDWAILPLINELRSNCMVTIGSSLTDPNLRSALQTSKKIKGKKHYSIMRLPTVDKDLLVWKFLENSSDNKINRYTQIINAPFENLKVEPLWMNDEEISSFIKDLSK